MEQDRRLAATARLLEVMNTLREKCPWDREQTFDSLRSNTIEETYELADALLDHNMEGIKEELGDLLLHVVFYSKLGEEAGAFDYADVADALCDKLIYRHPHVYGDIHASTPDAVKENWEALKLRKKKRRSGTLGGVPRSLPALVKALRIGEKAAATGFDWERREDVWAKVRRRPPRWRPKWVRRTGSGSKANSATSFSHSSTPRASTASTPNRRSNARTRSSSAASIIWRNGLPPKDIRSTSCRSLRWRPSGRRPKDGIASALRSAGGSVFGVSGRRSVSVPRAPSGRHMPSPSCGSRLRGGSDAAPRAAAVTECRTGMTRYTVI